MPEHAVRLDLHVHTRERSRCGQNTAEEMIAAALRGGLDGLAFTDHSRFVPEDELRRLREKFAPFSVLQGIETGVTEGYEILVYGFSDPLLESARLNYRELWALVRERAGALVIPHPFINRPEMELDLRMHPPDGLEAYSWECDRHSVAGPDKTVALAASLGVPILSNSDGHAANGVMGLYFNRFARRPGSDEDLATLVRAGSLEACRREPTA